MITYKQLFKNNDHLKLFFTNRELNILKASLNAGIAPPISSVNMFKDKPVIKAGLSGTNISNIKQTFK